MDFLRDGTGTGPLVLLAHGAGAAMDTVFMTGIARGLAAEGLRVARFEFAYMAARRTGGPKRPPPKITLLQDEFRDAVQALAGEGPLIIGGKSMGGRVASLIADPLFAEGAIRGVLCLGYPFHPTGKPEKLRTEHLAAMTCPTLICQGTRDPFGTRDEVDGYALSDRITLHWLQDGDHDFRPRRTVTGQAQADLLTEAAGAVARWAGML
ncbi:alpha/beta family hydrolase [Tropicibacter sp. S64]|uniref:alpha/beta family hydrolase n=1 Tax=Tropicibacter sp. S64 TaxID=3415122 RepID=UPI003C7A1BE5